MYVAPHRSTGGFKLGVDETRLWYEATTMSLERPHFDAPPLVEAVFDCFVEPSGDLSDLRAFEASFFARFPDYQEATRQEWQRFETKVEFKDGKAIGQSLDAQQIGVRRWNADKNRGVLIGPSVMALNVVPPYGRFEDHAPHLRELAEAFISLARPKRIEWLGHRYINQVQLNLAEQQSPARLFTLYPAIPEHRAMTHPPVTVQLEAARFQEGVVLTTLNLSARTPDKAIYSLDVYARTVGEVAASASSIAGWHSLAHGAIMDAFLGSVSAEARKRFKERSS